MAANFAVPAKEIAAKFKVATGDTATLNFGSSGQFVTEISNGVFWSANIEHAKKSEQAGLTVPDSRFTYATGHLLLWGENPDLVDDQGRILARGISTHVAMAGPGAAPYGWAAVQFRRNKGLWDAILSKLVTGKSNAQAYEFVKIGGAEIGFVALSQVIDKRAGSEWKVPARSHASITAAGSIVKARGGQQSRQGIY